MAHSGLEVGRKGGQGMGDTGKIVVSAVFCVFFTVAVIVAAKILPDWPVFGGFLLFFAAGSLATLLYRLCKD